MNDVSQSGVTMLIDFGQSTGRADEDGWSANITQDSVARILYYGSWTSAIPTGNWNATFRVQIDSNTGDNNRFMNLDVYDVTAGRTTALLG